MVITTILNRRIKDKNLAIFRSPGDIGKKRETNEIR